AKRRVSAKRGEAAELSKISSGKSVKDLNSAVVEFGIFLHRLTVSEGKPDPVEAVAVARSGAQARFISSHPHRRFCYTAPGHRFASACPYEPHFHQLPELRRFQRRNAARRGLESGVRQGPGFSRQAGSARRFLLARRNHGRFGNPAGG